MWLASAFARLPRAAFHALPGVGAMVLIHAGASDAVIQTCLWLLLSFLIGADVYRVAMHHAIRRFGFDHGFGRVFRSFHQAEQALFRGRLYRERERSRFSSAFWYGVGVLLVYVFFPLEVAYTGVLTLAFGDPAARLAGQRFGKRRFFGNATWVGTGAFIAVAFLVIAASHVFHHTANPVYTLPYATVLSAQAVAVVFAALAETVPWDLDNVLIPVVAAIGMQAML